MRISFLTLFLLFVCASIAGAQCEFNIESGTWETPDGDPCFNAITTAVPFLRIIPDSRSGAMGDAGIAVSPDPNSMHHNASNLAFVDRKFSISTTYSPWLRALGISDIYMAYLSGYYKIDDLQALGFGVRYFSLGEINFTDEAGVSQGTGRPNEFELAAAYARKLGDNFSMAISGKFIYSSLASDQRIGSVEIKPGISGAADVSATYITETYDNQKLKLGIAVTNLGAKISYTESSNKFFIPANLGIGAGYTFNFDEYNKLVFAYDMNKLLVPTPLHPADPEYDVNPADGIPDYRQQTMFSAVLGSFNDAPNGTSEELTEISHSIGMEYWYDDQFAVRGGYFHEHVDKGNRKYFTLGMGLKYNVFNINVSYLVPTNNLNNPLGNTLRFSLIFDISAFQNTPDTE